MLKVYEAALVSDAEQVRELLERRGIDAYVFGEHTYGVLGVNPLAWPHLGACLFRQFDRLAKNAKYAKKSILKPYCLANACPSPSCVSLFPLPWRSWRLGERI